MTAFAGSLLFNAVTLLPIVATPMPVKTTLEMAQGSSQISLALLKNATYTIPDLGENTPREYTLNNGQYKEGSTTITAMQPIAVGDVNQDGEADAAVILAVNTGGSGTFMYLASTTIQNGQVSNLDTIPLGDRVRVQSLKIKDGRIRLNILTHQADDPQCCPSQLVSMAYQLNDQAGTLKPIELSDQEKQQIHVEDLPSQMLPGDANEPFQPQDDQFQIKF
ncbi:MAG: hypothetical protein VKL20_04625 [Synechocystis sp.]|nr:hypothetical protein [Synechocystis sp.]